MRRRRILACLLLVALLIALWPALASSAGGVSGLVFVDEDADGLYMEGEELLSGVEVTLVSAANDQPMASLVTQLGTFSFQGLAPGPYYVQFQLPRGHVPTRFDREGSLAIPSIKPQGRTAVFTVGGEAVDIFIGAMDDRQAGFVRAIAFGDDNLNGGRFSSEPLLKGVQLEVLFELDGEYHQVGTAVTDKEGVGTIRNIAPGTYQLGATMSGSYIIGPLGSKINLFYNAIVPSEGNYGRSEPFQLPLRGSVGMGVGGARTGTARGVAWDDLNMNGKQDAGEPGAAHVEVLLVHLQMGVERSVVTSEDGVFHFPSLQPGDYQLTARLQDDRMFTVAGGDSALSSDTQRQASRTVSIAADTENNLGLVGTMPNTALTLVAYHDSNLTGTRDEGEPAFAGAKLEVKAGGQVLSTTVTDAQGEAALPLLRAQPLQLTVSLPDGQIFSVAGTEGGNDFYAATAESELTIDYTLQPGRVGRVQAAVTLPASIGGTLYEDSNSNAVFDAGEQRLGGFSVQAVDPEGQVVAEAVTADDGTYTLPQLVPGVYEVRLHLKSPYIFSGAPVSGGELANMFLDQRADYGIAANVTVHPGAANDSVHGAVFRSGVVQGQVLLGDQLQGFEGNGLGGLEGVSIALMDEDGKEVSQYTVATTDAQGNFLLKGALPGTYSLRYTLPPHSAFTRPLTDERVYQSRPFDIQASDELEATTLYAVRTGSYAGQVYLDQDVDGVRTDKDQTLEGVRIMLESDNPDNTRETTPKADGSYLVEGLRPGAFTLKVTLPEDKLISFDPNSPLSPAIGFTNSAEVDIAMGQNITGQDIAAVSTHALGGKVYYDNDLSRDMQPDEPGAADMDIRLRHNLSKVEFTATTGADGTYSVPVLFPGDYTLSISLPEDHELYAPEIAHKQGAAWETDITLPAASASTTQNLGLVQFGSLSGQVWNLGGTQLDIGDLPVTLLSAQGAPVQKTTTGPDGAWRFDGLYPGQYMVWAQLPEGFRFAREADSRHTRFSLITADGSTVRDHVGTSNPFTLSMAQHLEDQDIGMGTMGQLGDFAWFDLDGDGMQDAGEPGVGGITIKLHQYGEVVAQAVTDEWGRWLLKDLYAGTYTVEVEMPAELKATKQQSEFPLVASVLPQQPGTALKVEGVVVPSGGRNLNCDFGFQLVSEGVLPPSLQNLPQRDWTPLVPTVPKRVR